MAALTASAGVLKLSLYLIIWQFWLYVGNARSLASSGGYELGEETAAPNGVPLFADSKFSKPGEKAAWNGDNSCNKTDKDELTREHAFVENDTLHVSVPCGEDAGSSITITSPSEVNLRLHGNVLKWSATIPAINVVRFELYRGLQSIAFQVSGARPTVIVMNLTNFPSMAQNSSEERDLSGSLHLIDTYHKYQLAWLRDQRTIVLTIDGIEAFRIRNVAAEHLGKPMRFRVILENVPRESTELGENGNISLTPARADAPEQPDLLLQLDRSEEPQPQPTSTMVWFVTGVLVPALVVAFLVSAHCSVAKYGQRNTATATDSAGQHAADMGLPNDIAMEDLRSPSTPGTVQRKSRPLVGDFLWRTLEDHPDEIMWLNREQRIFQILQSDALAIRWGNEPGHRSRKMTYDNMTHGIRKQGVAKSLKKGHPLKRMFVMQFPPGDQKRWPAGIAKKSSPAQTKRPVLVTWPRNQVPRLSEAATGQVQLNATAPRTAPYQQAPYISNEARQGHAVVPNVNGRFPLEAFPVSQQSHFQTYYRPPDCIITIPDVCNNFGWNWQGRASCRATEPVFREMELVPLNSPCSSPEIGQVPTELPILSARDVDAVLGDCVPSETSPKQEGPPAVARSDSGCSGLSDSEALEWVLGELGELRQPSGSASMVFEEKSVEEVLMDTLSPDSAERHLLVAGPQPEPHVLRVSTGEGDDDSGYGGSPLSDNGNMC